MNLALQPFGICSMVISRIKPFYIINSASSSFHSLFHVTLSLPCRCHGTLSFQVFRFNSEGLHFSPSVSSPQIYHQHPLPNDQTHFSCQPKDVPHDHGSVAVQLCLGLQKSLCRKSHWLCYGAVTLV